MATDLKIKQSGLYGMFGKSTPVDFVLQERLWHYTKCFSCISDKDNNTKVMCGELTSSQKNGQCYSRNELLKRCYHNLSANKKYGHKKRKVK